VGKKIKVLFTGNKKLEPLYATEYAAGADLKACIEETVEIPPGGRLLIPTGISLAIPEGWEAQVRPRSGLALKKGLTVLNSPGTIDSDYRGEVKVILINLSRETQKIEPEERIAQLVFSEVTAADFTYTESLPDTSRGSGGFGSTGK